MIVVVLASINTTRLQNTFPFLEKALTDIGLSIQPKKLEIMHFTRGPDQENPPFHLPSLNQPITVPKSLHWLGFHLDCHLYFTHHTKLLAAKVTRTVCTMCILGNLIRGMSHLQLRILTLTTVIPILMYGCQLWWGSRFSNSNTNHLQTALNDSSVEDSGPPWFMLSNTSCTFPPLSSPSANFVTLLPSDYICRLLLTNPVLKKIPLSRPNINLRFNNLLTKLCTDSSKKSLLARIAKLTNAYP